MQKRKKSLVALALGGVAALALGACASSGGDQSGEQAADGKKTVMTGMFIGSTADKELVDILDKVTEEFNADNEFGVEFQIETYENEQYKTRLASLMTSNSQPDVFFTWSAGYMEPFARGGKMLDLTPYLDADPEWKDRFQEGIFGPVTVDDKVYAVPNGQAVAVMYYNKAMFEEHGLEEPTDYAEFVNIVETFQGAGITPISAPVQDAWIAGQLLQQMGNSDAGIGLFDGIVDGDIPWNSPESVTAGDMLVELHELDAFPAGYLGMTNDEGRDLFTSGETAMYYMGSWDMATLSEDGLAITDNVGAFNIPPVDPSNGENVAVGDVDLAYAVSADTKNADAAVAYIREFSEPAVQEMYAYDAHYLVATDVELDESKLSPLYVTISGVQHELTGITPWWDRVFGAGEGVEFNNAAQAIIAGDSPVTRLDELQAFAEANADR